MQRRAAMIHPYELYALGKVFSSHNGKRGRTGLTASRHTEGISNDKRSEMNSTQTIWYPNRRFFRVPKCTYIVLVLVVLGAVTALAAAPAHATSVKGTFHYEDTN